MSELAPALRPRAALAGADLARAFYVFEAVLMSAIVLAGFWPFYAELPRPVGARLPLVYVHAAAFTAWLGLLAMQTTLVYRRNVRLHRKLGMAVAVYAAVLIVLGVWVGLAASAEHVRQGDWPMDQAAGFLVLPLGDMLLFGGFFAAGMVYRRVPATHKRLMLLASNAFIFPGAARFAEPNIPLILVIWFVPIVLAMIYDRVTAGRIHRVYWIGSTVMLVFFARAALMTAEPWLRVGRAIIGAML